MKDERHKIGVSYSKTEKWYKLRRVVLVHSICCMKKKMVITCYIQVKKLEII